MAIWKGEDCGRCWWRGRLGKHSVWQPLSVALDVPKGCIVFQSAKSVYSYCWHFLRRAVPSKHPLKRGRRRRALGYRDTKYVQRIDGLQAASKAIWLKTSWLRQRFRLGSTAACRATGPCCQLTVEEERRGRLFLTSPDAALDCYRLFSRVMVNGLLTRRLFRGPVPCSRAWICSRTHLPAGHDDPSNDGLFERIAWLPYAYCSRRAPESNVQGFDMMRRCSDEMAWNLP